MSHVAGRERRDARRQELPVRALLVRVAMPPQLAERIPAEDLPHRPRERWLAHQRDQPGRVLAQLVPAHPAVRLLDARMPHREQPTQILVARALLDEQRHPPAVRRRIGLPPAPGLGEEVHARTADRLDSRPARRAVETRKTVHAVRIRERERPMSQLCRPRRQLLGRRAPLQKTEGAPRA